MADVKQFLASYSVTFAPFPQVCFIECWVGGEPSRQCEDCEKHNCWYSIADYIFKERRTVVDGVKLVVYVIEIQFHQLSSQCNGWQFLATMLWR